MGSRVTGWELYTTESNGWGWGRGGVGGGGGRTVNDEARDCAVNRIAGEMG